jgi:PTH2 family peptidyl-tRNA hydrolase
VEAKQVIVMRKFDKLRTGKYCAQAAHASMAALLSLGGFAADGDSFVINTKNPFVRGWLSGKFKKITCYVDTEAEIFVLHQKAQELGLPSYVITDSGLTEFGGIPTVTAVGIGPADAELINQVTGKLSLF